MNSPFTLWQIAAWNFSECPARSYFPSLIMMRDLPYHDEFFFRHTAFFKERNARKGIFKKRRKMISQFRKYRVR